MELAESRLSSTTRMRRRGPAAFCPFSDETVAAGSGLWIALRVRTHAHTRATACHLARVTSPRRHVAIGNGSLARLAISRQSRNQTKRSWRRVVAFGRHPSARHSHWRSPWGEWAPCPSWLPRRFPGDFDGFWWPCWRSWPGNWPSPPWHPLPAVLRIQATDPSHQGVLRARDGCAGLRSYGLTRRKLRSWKKWMSPSPH